MPVADFLPTDSQNPGAHRKYNATIANGASESEAIDTWMWTLLSVQMPAAWTLAALTVLGSADGVTYGTLVGASGALSVAAPAVNEVLTFDPAATFGVRYIKLKSGTVAAPVNQGAARTLMVTGRMM